MIFPSKRQGHGADAVQRQVQACQVQREAAELGAQAPAVENWKQRINGKSIVLNLVDGY